MKKTLLAVAVLGLLLLGGWWGTRPPRATVATRGAVPTSSVPDSLLLTSAGLVGAGGEQPLRAGTRGRVRKLYFTGGEYVHQGDVLAKLYNYNFVLAPRDGFLGSRRLAVGQYLTPTTLVTTISRYRTLAVSITSADSRGRVRPGDSVRVWVASRPARVVTGVVNSVAIGAPLGALEVRLAAGAPFRLGERVCVDRTPLPRPAATGAVATKTPAR
ncbi:HlyD family efflux transporter periplasmic adaptor subunit [Hymenobacter sp.]|uniref:HlyD family efflux transporter periplasmic adaptor subunit n=1 Tax=Hymenobacter sp. TaxID=1898978 RepID=UPI00286BDF53|nr:HlyD family efflux transporter periplasmic adaptor subunit [Hymenobacter sp.]